jgi:hypothetical protein
LRDHDAHTPGESLSEAGADQGLHRRAERAECRDDDVGGHSDERGPASPEPVGERPGDQLAHGEADQAGRDGQLRHRGGRAQLVRERRQRREVEIHRDGAEDRQHEQQRGQRAAVAPTVRGVEDGDAGICHGIHHTA